MSEHSFQTQAQVEPVNSNGDRFGFALFLAIAVHALIIFGIGFSIALSDASPPTLEVTLSLHQSEQQPDQADYLAQHNQQGSGDQAEKSEITTDRIAEIPAPAIQETNPVSAAPTARPPMPSWPRETPASRLKISTTHRCSSWPVCRPNWTSSAANTAACHASIA